MSKGYISFSYDDLRRALQLPDSYTICALVDHPLNEGMALIVESPDIPEREKQPDLASFPPPLPPRVHVYHARHTDHDGNVWQSLSQIEVRP